MDICLAVRSATLMATGANPRICAKFGQTFHGIAK